MPGVTRRTALQGLSTTPLWAASGSLSASAARGTRIAVIGAGAFGGWTALHLRRLGAQVTLHDAWGPGNSRSSSGGETRVIRGFYGRDRIYTLWVVRALELWKENQDRWKTLLYQRTGVLWMCGQGDTYARESLPIAHELGMRADRLERSDVERRYPQIDFDGVKTLYFEHEAGYLKARHACQTVCEQFQREGGKFVQAAAAPGAIRSGKMERLELAGGEPLVADHYVFACGPWLGSVFPEVIGPAIRPTRQEVYYFGAPSGDSGFEPGTFPVWIDFDERLYYGFPSIDRRGIKIADDTRGAAFDPTGGDRTPSLEGVEDARRFLARRFPRLRSAPLLEARVCQYENSPDGHFLIDRHPEASNVWLVGGGSGHGFKLGPVVGEHVAQCAIGAAKPEPLFSIARLAQLKDESSQFDRNK